MVVLGLRCRARQNDGADTEGTLERNRRGLRLCPALGETVPGGSGNSPVMRWGRVGKMRNASAVANRHIVLVSASAPSSNILVAKLIQALGDRGISIVHYCLSRPRDVDYQLSPPSRVVPLVVTRRDGKLAKRLSYILWMLRLWRRALQSRGSDVVLALNVEAALPVVLAGAAARCRLIYWDADNISLALKWPAAIRAGLSCLERLVARHAMLHVVPGEARWPIRDKNLRICANAPTTADLEAARRIAEERGYERSGTFTVLVIGWLVETRGMAMIRAAADMLAAEPIRFTVVGAPACPEVGRDWDAANVERLGALSSKEALAQYFKSDVVLTLYDPRVPLNRLAEPNKWRDCAATGTPFIVNDEVETAGVFRRAGACFSVPYDDAASLAELLRRLSRDRSIAADAGARIGELDGGSWDVGLDALLNEAYQNG